METVPVFIGVAAAVAMLLAVGALLQGQIDAALGSRTDGLLWAGLLGLTGFALALLAMQALR